MSTGGPIATRYTKKTRVSWLSRLGNAFIGIPVGLLVMITGIVLLSWNEGRAVQTARSLAEAGGIVVSVDAGTIDPVREGALVHVTGTLSVPEAVADPEFGIAEPVARLVRTVEMYQWEEERRTETRQQAGGSEERITTYNYRPVWSDREIDSSRFERAAEHRNPPKPYANREAYSEAATLGAFAVDRALLRQLPASKEVRVPAEAAGALTGRFDAPVTISDGRILVGNDPASPQIGDLRISFSAAPAGPISVMGRQSGSGFSEYPTPAGDAILMAEAGMVPADQMIRAAERENTIMTWLLRLAGAAAIFFGVLMVLQPVAIFADVVPLLGSIVRGGTGLVATAVTLVLAPLVLAVAWLAYRPITAVVVFALGAGAAISVQRLIARRAAAGEEAQKVADG